MFVCFACVGSGASIKPSTNVITKSFDVAEFSSVLVESPFDVSWTQASSPSVKVTAPDNVMPYIKVVNAGGRLKLRLSAEQPFKDLKQLKVAIASASLAEVNISGASDFEADVIDSPTFSLTSSGASDFDADKISASTVKIVLSGASDTEINSLVAKDVKINVSGASDASVDLISTSTLSLSASGASEAELKGSLGRATVNASGSSSIELQGKADYASLTASGASEIDASKCDIADGTVSSTGASTVKGF